MKKSKAGEVHFAGFRKLVNGDYRARFDNFPKDLQEHLYKQALDENVLTLKDLEFQTTKLNKKEFIKLVISAQFISKLTKQLEIFEKHEQKRRTKRQKAV